MESSLHHEKGEKGRQNNCEVSLEVEIKLILKSLIELGKKLLLVKMPSKCVLYPSFDKFISRTSRSE